MDLTVCALTAVGFSFNEFPETEKAEGISMSKFAARAIKDSAGAHAWPEGFWDLHGALTDPSFKVDPDSPTPLADPKLDHMFDGL